MEKRLIVAVALSLLILLTWSAWVSKTQRIENKEVITKELTLLKTPPSPTPALALEPEFPATGLFKQTQAEFEVTFIEPLAAIQEVSFKAYRDSKFPLKYGFALDDKSLVFKKESSSADSVTFVYSDQNKKIIKKYTFSNSDYSVWLVVEVQNLSNLPLKINLPLVLGVLDFSPKNIQARFQDVTIATKDKVVHLNANVRKNLEFPEAKFLSLRDRYFCLIVEPESNNHSGFLKKINPKESELGLLSQELVLAPGKQIGQKFRIYLGPQELRFINRIKPEWSAVVYYGTFDFISQILLQLLEFFYRLVHNWGWAIVILSLTVYLLLYPFTLKQMRSMKEMQKLQPYIEELRKQHKDNPQKLNKEIMELYREHKVNPLGGCLPLILQMPIFFALYQALMRSVALKGAKFLWIKDLSEPDKLFLLPFPQPFDSLNILPILMMIGMFVQQKISAPATASSSTAEQQKLMLLIMPLMFGFIFYSMPAGLVLYWFINSTLMLLYQLRISKRK